MSTLLKLIPRKERLLKFRGAMAPVLTPYDKNGEVNVSQIPKYVKYLVDNKVDGLYILGTNGEGYNLTNDERLSIVKAWRQALDKHQANLVSVVNVSSYCVKEALDLSKHVESMGFDAIAVLPPNYYKPNSVDDWLNFLKGFGRAAPNTPLLYYHIPRMTGELNFDLIEAMDAGLKQIPQFSAIKYSGINLLQLSALHKLKDELKVFLGLDQPLLTVLTALDFDSAITGMFNLQDYPDIYKRFLDFNGRLDLVNARTEQNKLLDVNAKMRGTGNPFMNIKVAFNESVKHLGIDMGLPRPPIHYHYSQ